MHSLSKSTILLLAIAIHTTASAQDATRWANTARYDTANDSLITAGIRPSVVLMGNSITEMWPVRNSHIFDTHPDIAARGISGQTTSQMLLRFDSDVVTLRPRAVVINGGTNDIALNAGTYREDFTMANIRSMAAIARANCITPILTSVLPAAGFIWRKDVTEAMSAIKSLNKRISAYAAAEGIGYIDYFSTMVNDSGDAMKDEYSSERPAVHPNHDGYSAMETPLLEAIAPYLNGTGDGRCPLDTYHE